MKISVVIPTYQRPRTLLPTLKSLQEQSVMDFEILVMDNAVQAEIEQAVKMFNKAAKAPARYVPEPRTGGHYARNHAAKIATGELLLYTDDDMNRSGDRTACQREPTRPERDVID